MAKRIATTAKKKTVRKKPVRTVTKRTTKRTPRRRVAVKTTIAPVTPVITPVLQTGYKEIVPVAGNRAKLWLAVSICTFLVVCLWAYMLSQRLFNSTAIEDSLVATDVDGFMNSISDDLSDLQNSADQFVDATKIKQPTNPDNEQLDNLFSDLQ